MSTPSKTPGLEDRLIAYLRNPRYEAQDASAIARGMGIASTERPALRALLKEWQQSGKLVRLSQSRFTLRTVTDAKLTGRIRKLPKGKLLFIADADGQQELSKLSDDAGSGTIELPVQAHRDAGAMDGDLVRVTVRRNAPRAYGRRKGKPQLTELALEVRVDEILERRRGTWVGIYRAGGRYGYLMGDGKTAPESVRIAAPPPAGLLSGMVISANILNYPLGKMEASATIDSVLGWPDDVGVDITTIIHRYTLRDTFPPAVLREAEQLSQDISTEEYARRDDWRQELVFTIDPATARDYDDAICVKELAKDSWELAVHIADVSYYVKPRSALDQEAYLRGNSTYLPDRVLPMLPPKLCDDICSLRAGEDRLTRLCLMRINRKGEVFRAEFRNAVICSRSRLDYGTALAVIEGRGSTQDTEVDQAIKTAHKLATVLRKRRMKQGALNLEVPELNLILNHQGKVEDIVTERSDAAHQMIEEFMLAANEAVAHALTASMTPTIYRVHEEPDPAKLQTFADTARSYGIRVGALTSRDELVAITEQISGHEDEQILTTALLRAMMRARYATQALGHFGLAKSDYCHFTSPIRRYADLLVHRGFDRLVHGKHATVQLPPMGQMSTIAEHISETERNSAAAENEARQSKLAQFLADECTAESPRTWSGIITDAYPQGLAVEIPALQMKGFVGGDELETAYGARWFFERHTRRWSSTDGRFLLPGDTLQLIPCNVDLEARFIDFRPAEGSEIKT